MAIETDLFEKARTHERLEQLKAAREHDLLPYFRQVDGEPGPVVVMEGRERITLGSNNYLGLTTHPRVKQAARDALEAYGTGLTGSRFMNGTTPLHLRLERELRDWMGTEDALVFTTGYQANVGCIATLLEPGDTVICDSGDHASILDAVMMSRARIRPFRHNRLPKLASMLERSAADGGGVLVVVDGVFSMEGDLAPLPRRPRPLPCPRRPADGRRGPRRGCARGDRHRRLRGLRRGGRGRPAHGDVLQVARLLWRVYRRAGRGDRLPARPSAGVHVHRLRCAGGGGSDARRAGDHPLGRGPRAAGTGARERPLPPARPGGPGVRCGRSRLRCPTDRTC